MMFGERRVSALVRRYAEDRGYPSISVCQPQHLFDRTAERRLPRVATPTDRWQAIVREHNGLDAESHYGVGATPDEAVLSAIPHNLMRAIHRLESAVDNLRDCLQK